MFVSSVLYFLSLMFHTGSVGLSIIYITIQLALGLLHWLQHIHTSQYGPWYNSGFHLSPAPIFLFENCSLPASVAKLFSLWRHMLVFCSYICYHSLLLMWLYFTFCCCCFPWKRVVCYLLKTSVILFCSCCLLVLSAQRFYHVV